MRGRLIAGAVALALLSLVAPAGAQLPIGGGPNPPVPVPIPVPSGAPPAEPYGTNDYGGFRDILPPGTNGLDNGAQLAAFLATGQRPPHNDDQLAMYARPRLRGAGPEGRRRRQVLQGRDVRRQARRRRSRRSRRAPTSRSSATRASASRTSTAPRAPARCSAPATPPPRTACSSSTCCATLGRARAVVASPAARRATARWTQEQWSLAPYTEADLQHQIDQLDDLYGAEGAAAPAGRSTTTSPASTPTSPRRGSTRPRCPASTPRSAGRRAPTTWKVHRHHRDRVAGRRRSSARAAARSSRRSQVLQRASRERFGAEPRRAGCGRDFRLRGPGGADDRHDGQALPLPGRRRQARRPGGRALPDAGSFKALDTAPASRHGAARARRHGRRHERRGGHPRRPGRVPDRRCPTRCCVSAREVGVGHPLAVFGPQIGYFAPQILMEEDVHAPGHRRPRRRLPRRQPLRRSSATAATTRGARPRPARTSSTRSRSTLCDPTAARRRSLDVLPRPVPRRSRCSTATNSWTPERSPTRRRPAPRRCAPQRTKLGLVAGRGTVKGKPVAYTRAARDLLPRGRLGARVHGLQRPRTRSTAPQDFQRAAVEDRLHVQLVLRRRQAHRLLQLGQQPGARARASTGQLPIAAPQYEWQGFNPDTQHRATTRRFASTRRSIDQDYITSWNNKQAPGYARRRLERCSARCTARSCSTSRSRRAHRAAGEDDAAGAGRRDGGGRHRPTCAAQEVLPLALR